MRNSKVFDAWLDAFAVTIEYSDAVEFGKILECLTKYATEAGEDIFNTSGDDAMQKTAKHLKRACEAWDKRRGN